MSRAPSRRAVLRGAGVALALPWLESLAPRAARAQAAEPRRTFVAFSFPCGVTKFWKPAATGAGDAWALSPLLQPLAPLKSHVTVLGNVGNLGPFGGHIEPAHSYLNAAFLTCAKVTSAFGAARHTLGPSVDQVLAKGIAGKTRLSSLQVGLSTTLSYPDGLPAEFSRCISWASETEPLAKVISPQAVFDAIVGTGLPTVPSSNPDVFSSARRAANKSVLDFVTGHATSVRTKLGRSDQKKMDDFLGSVRELEMRVDRVAAGGACALLPRPSETWTQEQVAPAGYDRDAHANLMIDLVLMALRCDVTRVVSFMFDDSRSDFDYGFLRGRTFDAPGATPYPAGFDSWGLHALQNTSETSDRWSIVIRWFVEKLARFCAGLKASDEGAGTMLDASTVWFGSEMNGANHSEVDLPLLYVGGGGGRLKTNRYVDFAQTPRMTERLANVYLTFLRHVFDLSVTTFGSGPPRPGEPIPQAFGAGTDLVPEIIAP